MKFSQYRYLVLSDLYRYTANVKLFSFLKQGLIGEGFRYSFWLRTTAYTRQHYLLRYIVYPFTKFLFRHHTYKFGISIHETTEIGPGFYIGHFGGVVVSSRAKIGRNCNLSQGVTIGRSNGGKFPGYPTLGNNVYVGPGAKIIGGIYIGDNVAIGANCVVTKNIPENAVVVGVPGKPISSDGSAAHINRTDYDRYLKPNER